MENTPILFIQLLAFQFYFVHGSNHACMFTINDEDTLYDSYLFDNYDQETIVKFPMAANLGLCSHKLVAVGGYGNTGYGVLSPRIQN
jgi:hypothetical protein